MVVSPRGGRTISPATSPAADEYPNSVISIFYHHEFRFAKSGFKDIHVTTYVSPKRIGGGFLF